MNIILFEPHEIGKPLSRWDERTSHLLKVLHKKTGDSFEAGVLGGDMGTGRIDAVRFDGALFYSLDLKNPPPPRLSIRIGLGFPRPIQLKRILRDLSALGLQALDLMGTDLGEKSYRDTKLLVDGGARTAMIEGAMQARDTGLPILEAYQDLGRWLWERPWERPFSGESGGFPLIGPGPLLIAADNVRPEGSLVNLPERKRPIILAVGNERGWSDRERGLLEEAGFLRLSMGKRAMRTETACLAAVILAMEKLGELE